MSEKQVEEVRVPAKPLRLGCSIVAFTVGAVLAGSENRGVKALGAGIAVSAVLHLLNKLATLAD